MARYDHVVLYDSTDEEAILMLTKEKELYPRTFLLFFFHFYLWPVFASC